MIRKALATYVDQAPVLMPAAAVVFVFTGILSTVLVKAAPGLALIALLIGVVATTLFTGMVVELVADVQDGRRDATPGQLVRAVTPVFWSLFAVALVAGVGIVIGFFLIVVPGLILMTIWAVAAPAVVLERPPGLGALSRSRELVRGNGWQVFAVIFLLWVLVAVVAAVLEVIAESAGTGAGIVARVVLGVLTAPLPALAAAVLYFDLLRVRGEHAPRAGGPARGPSPRADPFGGP
ncbi:MAG: hypothetical protein ACYDC2_12915 [Solirubrobacteraceae bacterium]